MGILRDDSKGQLMLICAPASAPMRRHGNGRVGSNPLERVCPVPCSRGPDGGEAPESLLRGIVASSFMHAVDGRDFALSALEVSPQCLRKI